MFIIRFLAPLTLSLLLLAIVTTPLAERAVSSWFRYDVELRAKLIYDSVEEALIEKLQVSRNDESLRKLFDKIAQDERVLAVGLCAADGQLRNTSKLWPSAFSCPSPGGDKAKFETVVIEGKTLLAGTFPLNFGLWPAPYFVVLHDLSFGVQRSDKTKLYVAGFLVLVSLIAALVTILMARLTLNDWMKKLRSAFSDPELRVSGKQLPREFIPLMRDMRQMLRDTKSASSRLDSIRVNWTPETLARLLETELPGQEVIVVSNREPYIHEMKNGKIVLQRPASGLVTALEPITRACKGLWIAHGSGSADKQMVDEHDCIRVPPDRPEYTLHRVWLTQEEEDGYYYGFANEGIWPLCHIAFVRPAFRENDWQTYKAVNKKFANAVAAKARTKNPVVLVQDYQLAMLPRYVRELMPDATILTFWHIPWPNSEVFSICPWREEILSGLLGSSVIGFHTQFHCQNFLDTVDRFLESNINRDQSIVTQAGHETLVRPYPISIAWPPEGMAELAPASDCRAAIAKRFNLPKDALIGVGIERLDYTKGIIDRLHAVREVLRHRPEWHGRFVFIQAAAPTRSRLPAYQAIQQETMDLAESINKEFGNKHYTPVILLARHHEPVEVFELFRAADFCVVSSLHDGMNLVAKEFVAARDDEKGVLILSTFAGASKELMDALLVNPYDTTGMADAMQRALMMNEAEQRERIRLLREMVRDNNIYYWAARILLDAAFLRKRGRIKDLLDEPPENVKDATPVI